MPDQEDIDQLKERLKAHRQTLAHYLHQRAKLSGAYEPPIVAAGIREAREEIARIKAILRSWQAAVDDHPDDTTDVGHITRTSKLPRYEIGRQLGVGAFATVYQAQDMLLRRDVALKIVHPHLLNDKKAIERFEREARAIAALAHPDIVSIYDSGELDNSNFAGRPFLSMQYMDEGSLDHYLVNHGPMALDELIEFIRPICAALDYTHQRGIIHRDIKPANILLRSDGQACLSDFGLAKLLDEEAMSSGLTSALTGTPSYIAPELWEEDRATPQSDIYALGCVIFEMIVGRRLFPITSGYLGRRVHEQGPQFPKQWPEGIPQGVEAVIRRATARKPGDRYATAGALLRAVEAAAQPISGPPILPPTNNDRKKNRPMYLLIFTIFVLASVLFSRLIFLATERTPIANSLNQSPVTSKTLVATSVVPPSAQSQTVSETEELTPSSTTSPTAIVSPSTSLNDDLARATYRSIQNMVEPSTGLPHDRFDASLYDIAPQFAFVRSFPYTGTAAAASLTANRCTEAACRRDGDYGLELTYQTPAGTFANYNIDSLSFDISNASYLEGWVKGTQGGERFEVVLWSDCEGVFPGRPESALITASTTWARWQISLADFLPFGDITSLCRLSIGFNDAIALGGTIFLDSIAFLDDSGSQIHVALDEETNLSNIGLYIASVVGAIELGEESYDDTIRKLDKTLTSIEQLQTWHGFPQAHNYIISLKPSNKDQCISTVDLGNYAAGLIILRQRIPELAARASVLLDAMEWSWLYDQQAGLPYGCRYPDGSASSWHYDWLAADSRLAHAIGIGTGGIPAASWSNLSRERETPLCMAADAWHFQPGWQGGGQFMALLPGIFLDEAGSEIGTSTQNFILDQICYAQAIDAPAWGWSSTAVPPFGADYCGYGQRCDELIVPHASLLAIELIGATTLTTNLQKLEQIGARAKVSDGEQKIDYGFRSAINWKTGEVSSTYLILDQSMAFLSLVNAIKEGHIRSLFCQDSIVRTAISQIPDYNTSCSAITP